MRCKSCGWVNSIKNASCEKCNTPLNEARREANNPSVAQEKQSAGSEPKKTTKCCPECGYPVREPEKECPECRFVFGQNKQDRPAKIASPPLPQSSQLPQSPEFPPLPQSSQLPQSPELPPLPQASQSLQSPQFRQSPQSSQFRQSQQLQQAQAQTPVQVTDYMSAQSHAPDQAPDQASDQPPAPPKTGMKYCTFCNSPIAETARFCINCGVSFVHEKKRHSDTIMPWLQAEIQTPKCSLSFVSKDGAPVDDAALRFSGNVIQLNRGNTEPGNPTITSKIQAELSFENGQWHIQDKSALKTTYIYAGEKVALKSGDIIVLGNRLFAFDSDSEK